MILLVYIQKFFGNHAMHAIPRKGLWLQHMHDSAQTFFFGKGSFACSFPVLSLGSLAYVRQLAALQRVSINFHKDTSAWIKDGENGIMLWTSPGKLYYIQRQHAGTSVVLFEHYSVPEHSETYVFGRLGALLRHMHLLPSGKSDEKLERLLFVWLYPQACFNKTGVLGHENMELDTKTRDDIMNKEKETNSKETWQKQLFFVLIHHSNHGIEATVEVKKGTEQSNKGSASAKPQDSESSFLSREEWSRKGELKLHVNKL